MVNKPKYDVILSNATMEMINTYKNALLSNTTKSGAYLEKILNDERINLANTSNEKFIELLLWTKKPMIFAESEIVGDGTDWNMEELSILGDLCISMEVSIYDNEFWSTQDEYFHQYEHPLNGMLLFLPGPLLRKPSIMQGNPPDYQEVVDNDNINQSKYNRLMERRLAPLLLHISEIAAKDNTRAFVTIPGVGCGQFAGRFEGTMGERLKLAIENILTKHGQSLPNTACVYYDPYNECKNESKRFHDVKFRVRPSRRNPGKALLCEPKQFEEAGDDFTNCKLFKVVAWDHVSYPGNDFFSTDDGVSAAATNSMQIVAGVEGKYDYGKYLPPDEYCDWEQVVQRRGIKLKADSLNIHTYSI